VHKFVLPGVFLCALAPLFSQTPQATVQEPTAAATVAPMNQRRVDPAAMYHRVYAVVPMVGTGTKDDPFRPMFISTTPKPAADRTGILAYQMQASDDGRFALVELVGITRLDLLPVITSNAFGVTVFERGNATQAQIEAEFQKYKKNFTLNLFNTRVQ
jgi:hypothetical protein